MADALISIKKTLIHEGEYVNDLNDAGGETNMGISKRQYPNLDIKNLTESQAVEIYRDGYWKPYYSQIKYQSIADKLFDMGVLFGVGTAVEILQIVLQTTTDKIFGAGTLAAVNAVEPIGLLEAYKTALVSHAVAVVGHNPQDRVFFQGWVRRINS